MSHQAFTDDEIIEYYEYHTQSSASSFISKCLNDTSIPSNTNNLRNGRLVILPPRAIIKSGLYITDEAQNLQSASSILSNTSILKVPKLYRAFERHGMGYMVMEYIPGRHLHIDDEEEVDWLVGKAVEVVKYFWGLGKGDIVGAVGGGRCRGYWWSSDFPKFEDKKGLEEWFLERLQTHEKQYLRINRVDMVLCHMDLVSRNILIIEGEDKEKEVVVVDWESAGWFPRMFEVARLEMVVSSRRGLPTVSGDSNVISSEKEMKFERKLLEKLKGMLDADEIEMIEGVRRAWEGV
ncbi:hypothetical protein TWF970_004167 [Orbilia oligospora]|uniref:Aminoglycoside phosphotransferase domain-containing protein n=1 Tax=Orbilia oligospora TaxID=2813651 RepID=A0A7C8VAT3_ORBOL|nr:hypothetical protein TWF970_004167 [Orbilia oligospora]